MTDQIVRHLNRAQRRIIEAHVRKHGPLTEMEKAELLSFKEPAKPQPGPKWTEPWEWLLYYQTLFDTINTAKRNQRPKKKSTKGYGKGYNKKGEFTMNHIDYVIDKDTLKI